MSHISIEPLDLERDLDVVHAWVTHPRSTYWMMQHASTDDVRSEYTKILAHQHHDAWLGRVRGIPTFLVETYDPAHSELAGVADLGPGDLGMHLLVAPTDGPPEPGLTTEVFRVVMEFCFRDQRVTRVVVEPDIRNSAIRAKNVAAGFVEVREIVLPGKTAILATCTRADFVDADQVSHLTPRASESAQRRLIAKAIAEYAHERLIEPIPTGAGWSLTTPGSSYAFTARQHLLNHWVVDADSIVRTVNGASTSLDAQDLIAETAPALGIPHDLLPVYLEEIASTLASSAWKLTRSTPTAAELVEGLRGNDVAVGFQRIEAAMTEGHPAFVANNGRIGFGVDDYHRYAPETGSIVRLQWIGLRRKWASLSLSDGLDEATFYRDQLGEATVVRFRQRLKALGLRPDDYLLAPIHPWQWRNKIAITFAPDVARRDVVFLGQGPDACLAQQSIRTFFDHDRPERHYTKVALSIQNMGFMRGLSPAYMAATPAINDWVAETVHGDPVLRAHGFRILREVASIGYTGDAFHRRTRRSPYQKMIAALWRESPVADINDGERLATMASLLHRDTQGSAFATELIRSSPVSPAEWVRTYLRAYLVPLVHCLYAYDLAFMPHGENLVMVLREGVPVRMYMKDIGEEIAVMGEFPLPANIERVRGEFPNDVKAAAIHVDVMDGFLRYLAALLAEDDVLTAEEFWAIARSTLDEYDAANPQSWPAAAAYDLRRSEFRHSCLNRLQLRNTLQMVDLTDQAESLIYAGTLQNPLAP